MTPQEALKEITSRKKWYITKKEHTGNTNRVSALRILNGTAESGAMKRFFAQYEYDVKIVVEKKIGMEVIWVIVTVFCGVSIMIGMEDEL